MLKLVADNIRSLSWSGDRLIDCVGGYRELLLDGTLTKAPRNYAYRFDAATMSLCGERAAIFEIGGTKGLLLTGPVPCREINRSYYCANAFEYPVAIFRQDEERALLVHCPEEYCRLEIEDFERGERLTMAQDRTPADFFHSRLRVSGDGNWLLSAGWFWHPWHSLMLFDLNAACVDSRALDDGLSLPEFDFEVVAAEFISPSLMLVATGAECLNGIVGTQQIGPNSLTVLEVPSGEVVSSVQTAEPVGTLMTLDENLAVGFFEYPKLLCLKTGSILKRWETIRSGNQMSSFLYNRGDVPPIATDPMHRRFAVADQNAVYVVTVD